MGTRRSLAIACAALIGVGLAWAPAGVARAAGLTLNVDVGTVVRPVTQVVAGGLYGVDTGNKPPLSSLYALSVNTFTQPPPGTQQLGNGATTPCCDGLQVAGKITNAGGQQYLRLPDIFSRFPYNWVSWADWEAKVRTMITARMQATNTTNIAGYELWNEPDCFWNTSTANDPNAGSFLDAWTRTYRIVRSIDATTPIVGPSLCGYNRGYLIDFMTHARNTGTLPQVVVWHELQDNSYDNVAVHVVDYRTIETQLGLPRLPISINEYASPAQVDVPGVAVQYMAKLERAGILDAERAYWFEAGTFNGLFHNNAPTASYWPYAWYGNQSGNVVATRPQSVLDGVASYDASRRRVDVIFAGDSGQNTVVVNGLAPLGGQVRVALESTGNTGRFTNQAAPTALSTATYTVTNGSITVRVPNMDARAAYHLVVTPVTGTPTWQQRYEAENATVINANRRTSGSASNGGYVGGIDNNTDMRTDSFVDFLVNVPTARSYTMTVRYANATGTTAGHGLAYNGGPFANLSYPATAGGWGNPTGSVSTTVALRAGYNMIRLAKGAPSFVGGAGFAELDYIELS